MYIPRPLFRSSKWSNVVGYNSNRNVYVIYNKEAGTVWANLSCPEMRKDLGESIKANLHLLKDGFVHFPEVYTPYNYAFTVADGMVYIQDLDGLLRRDYEFPLEKYKENAEKVALQLCTPPKVYGQAAEEG